jgi:hypothetical protein
VGRWETNSIQKYSQKGPFVIDAQTVIDSVWVYICSVCFKKLVTIISYSEAGRADMTLQCLLQESQE